MIREFALEPDLLSDWEKFRYFTEKFSVPQGRLISEFPRGWARRVYDACASCGDVQKKRIEEGLSRIRPRLMRRGRDYDARRGWITNAVESHAVCRFRAIIASSGHPTCRQVVDGNELDGSHPALSAKSSAIILRRSRHLAVAVGPLLAISKQVLLIDPYFNPRNSRYQVPLAGYLAAFCNGRDVRDLRVEIHMGDRGKSTGAKRPFEVVEADCKTELTHCVPQGIVLTLKRWSQVCIHNRYVLTDRGVIALGTGIDTATGTGSQDDSVKLLDETVRRKLWANYCEGRGRLISAGDPRSIEVRGTRRIEGRRI